MKCLATHWLSQRAETAVAQTIEGRKIRVAYLHFLEADCLLAQLLRLGRAHGSFDGVLQPAMRSYQIGHEYFSAMAVKSRRIGKIRVCRIRNCGHWSQFGQIW